MIFFPFTVAATVLSGDPPLEEHAARAKAIAPASTKRMHCFEILRTWFLLLKIRHAAFATLPPLIQLVQTRILRAPPC
jgi:hypothetical protein